MPKIVNKITQGDIDAIDERTRRMDGKPFFPNNKIWGYHCVEGAKLTGKIILEGFAKMEGRYEEKREGER